MFTKLGENIEISRIENVESCIPAVSEDILNNFRKFANNLKKIAPKAEDFLYFSAVMMHAAEASAINEDGTPKLTSSGEAVKVSWDTSGGTWRWSTNDPSIKPYKNSNGDIFPEAELVKAHKKWVHKPLCIDHKSSSVDHVRGFIVDTYYDRNLKRVIALCALDKHNYPDLARKVATGYSSCVSMGTAVGKAICSDCATVARAESDFCKCMRNKTCYGEINVDLNPIELSIVVNGADPKAHIKHIIAAANTMNSYLDNRNKELNKLAVSYTATIHKHSDPNGAPVESDATISVQGKDLESFKKDVERGLHELESYNSEINLISDNNDVLNKTVETPAVDFGLPPPHERFASGEENDKNSINELRTLAESIETKLNEMKTSLYKLTITSKEENMSGSNEISKKGYYQGTEEPTPGQAKYPKDPLNEQLRDNEDKQMVGQSPFPEVGPVDGMHPSPSSADPANELERKKMLARAEAEERAMKRSAIVNLAKQALENKKAYFQNGEGPNNPNTPTPGKVKYTIDKLNEDDRDNEDKQMVGQKPFPGVGAVDGMHPSPDSADVKDELKRKEMLQRASLRARFVKASNEDGSQNLAKSAWEVFLGDKLVLTASVNELSGGRTEMLYDTIATKDFGSKLIEKIKVHGAPAVLALVKKAQMPDAPPAAAPAPEAMPAAPEAAPMDEDTGKSGDPGETALELVAQARDVISDLSEAIRALVGEKAEMGEEMPMAAAASDFSSSSLNVLRHEINGELTKVMKEAVAELNNHEQELEMIHSIYEKGNVDETNKEFMSSLAEEAFAEAKVSIADAFKLMTAFVKYARGTNTMIKNAKIESELRALGEGDTTMTQETDSHSDDDLMSLIQEANDDLAAASDMADDNDLKASDLKPETELKPDMLKGASYETKAGRAALRAKLAADALGKMDDGQVQDMSKAKFSDMLDESESLANGQTKLDVKPSDNLGKVETPAEVNKEMMDLAKAPPKVRKEAEAIHKLVTAGHLDPKDIDSLVSMGLDKDAVAYYKKYFGEVDGGSEFASELVKEHVKAQMDKELQTYRVKLARAYELAYDMVDRGMCPSDRAAVSDQVDTIMKFNDENFEALKRVVAKQAPGMRKEAGRMPQVGLIGSGEVNSTTQADESLYSQLSAAFSKTSKKMF